MMSRSQVKRVAAMAGDESLETVEVPRAWIHEHGWPETFGELVTLAAMGEAGVVQSRRPAGDLLIKAMQHDLDVAFFREGPTGQALLFVQAWMGAA